MQLSQTTSTTAFYDSISFQPAAESSAPRLATGLGPRLSHLDSVLAVMDDIPGDERAARSCHQRERD
jgi:hypothetical protein